MRHPIIITSFVCFVILNLVALPGAAQESNSCDISKTPGITEEPEINISLRNGPPYHDFYDVFDTEGTLVIVSLHNPSSNDAEISAKISGTLSSFDAQIVNAPNPPKPVEGPYSVSIENDNEDKESKCIKRLGPDETYPVAFEIVPEEEEVYPPSTPSIEPQIQSNEIRVNASYPYNDTISNYSTTIQVQAEVPVEYHTPEPESNRIIIPVPSSGAILNALSLLATLVALFIAYISLKINLFPSKKQKFREKYQSTTSFGLRSIKNTIIYIQYRYLTLIRWFLEPIYLFVVSKQENYKNEYGVGSEDVPKLPPGTKSDDEDEK